MGWTVYDDSVERVSHEVPPELIASQQEEELKRIQHIVSGWLCTNDECGEHIVNMPLQDVAWVNHGKQPFVNPQTGDEGEADRWLAHIHCHSCGKIQMNPLRLWLYRGRGFVLHLEIQSHACVASTDKRINGCFDRLFGVAGAYTGSFYDDNEVPPHMQGTYCQQILWSDLEEE